MEIISASHSSRSQNWTDRGPRKNKRITKLWMMRIKYHHNHVWGMNAHHRSRPDSLHFFPRSALPRPAIGSMLSQKFPAGVSSAGALSCAAPPGHRGRGPGHSRFVSDTFFLVQFRCSIPLNSLVFQCFLIVFQHDDFL
jgi:hypothetical protein